MFMTKHFYNNSRKNEKLVSSSSTKVLHSSISNGNSSNGNKRKWIKYYCCRCISCTLLLCFILIQIEFLTSSSSSYVHEKNVRLKKQKPDSNIQEKVKQPQQLDGVAISVKEDVADEQNQQRQDVVVVQEAEEERVVDEINKSDNNSKNEDSNTNNWHVTIGHEPRYDLLGSFVLPTMFLYGITNHYSYTLQIFPFAGSQSASTLRYLFNLKGDIPSDWGSGFQNANHRKDYDPVVLNTNVYNHLGFFPKTSISEDMNIRTFYPWIQLKNVPAYGTEMNDICTKQYESLLASNDTLQQHRKMINNINDSSSNNDTPKTKNCYILLSDDPVVLRYDMEKFSTNGINDFYTPNFCSMIRSSYKQHNIQRIQELIYHPYNVTTTISSSTSSSTLETVFKTTTTIYDKNNNIVSNDNSTGDNNSITYYNVALHIRRGDITAEYRYIQQSVFATVAKHICEQNTAKNHNIYTNLHIFSSGPNQDGDWSKLEALVVNNNDKSKNPVCANIIYHMNEDEFDNWIYMIAIADALIISPSTFSYVPALIRGYDRQHDTTSGNNKNFLEQNNDNNGIEKVTLEDGNYYYHHLDVYFPATYWHPALSSFYHFASNTGKIKEIRT